MDGVGTLLGGISGLRISDFNADAIAVPAAVVSLPETVDYDFTMGRGSDHLSLKVHVLVGRVSDRAARDELSAYVTSSGARSIKAVIEADPTLGGAAQTTRVESAATSTMTVGGTDYLAASFTLDIVA